MGARLPLTEESPSRQVVRVPWLCKTALALPLTLSWPLPWNHHC
jgi:hypothetical protein